jgi:cytochrome c
VILPLAIVLLLLAPSAGLAQDRNAIPLEQQGRALAERMCSACHAVGRRGNSPHVAAPPFRALERRVELDTFTDRLREGLMSDHPGHAGFSFHARRRPCAPPVSKVYSGAINDAESIRAITASGESPVGRKSSKTSSTDYCRTACDRPCDRPLGAVFRMD